MMRGAAWVDARVPACAAIVILTVMPRGVSGCDGSPCGAAHRCRLGCLRAVPAQRLRRNSFAPVAPRKVRHSLRILPRRGQLPVETPLPSVAFHMITIVGAVDFHVALPALTVDASARLRGPQHNSLWPYATDLPLPDHDWTASPRSRHPTGTEARVSIPFSGIN
jgi:hypothetical protein